MFNYNYKVFKKCYLHTGLLFLLLVDDDMCTCTKLAYKLATFTALSDTCS